MINEKTSRARCSGAMSRCLPSKEANDRRGINKTAFVIGVVLMRVALDYAYANALCPYYAKYGMGVYSPNDLWLSLSYLSLGICSIICANVLDEKPSSLMMAALFLIAYIPATSLYYVQNLPHYYLAYATLFWLVFLSAFYFTRGWPKEVKARRNKGNDRAFGEERTERVRFLLACVPFAVAFAAFLYSVIYNGGVDLALDLSEYGELRQENKLASFGFVWQRLIFWSGCVFAPFGIAVSIMHRKYAFAVVFLLFDFSITATNGTKTFLFTLVLTVLAVWMLRRRTDLKWLSYIPFAISAIVVLGAALFETEFGQFVSNYITRRILFTPSYNCWGFVHFFQDSEKMHEIHRMLKWLTVFGVENPLGVDNVSQYMGTVIYGTTNNNNPAGTFGDAFMNFGVAGLIAYPILNVVCIRLLDGVAGNEPIAYLIAVVFSTTEYIVNGSFLPVLFNYGYFAFLIYLALIKKYGGLEATFGEWFGHGGYRAQGTGQSMQNTANRRNAGMGADGK